MPAIDLKYGESLVSFEYDASRFEILGSEDSAAALTDAEIGERLDAPIDSPLLEEIVQPGESVLIAVPDATRQAGSAQIVNLLVRRLIANGTAPHDIRIIFATGIHRKVTDDEKTRLLTPFITQRIKTLDHDARDLMQVAHLGETLSGIPAELNRALVEHDRVIIIGGVTFHYFAGFTGGRKLICPGLASSRTVSATHKLAFDCERKNRRTGVGTSLLDGNPVHEAFVEVAARTAPSFAINTIVNEMGYVTDLYCGDWITSHRAACDAFARDHLIDISEKRHLVVVSCGGYPFDLNMIQAHKAIEAASSACTDGGTIILLAECADGLGRKDFLDWFDAADSSALAERLCEKYQVNGQTAWSLLRKAERYDIRVVTALSSFDLGKMRLKKCDPADLAAVGAARGYLIPNGAKFHISCLS